MDTASSVSTWFGNLAAAIHRGLVRSGRARAARELARLGYYQEAEQLMLENQDQG
jgi:hypothetical protein